MFANEISWIMIFTNPKMTDVHRTDIKCKVSTISKHLLETTDIHLKKERGKD